MPLLLNLMLSTISKMIEAITMKKLKTLDKIKKQNILRDIKVILTINKMFMDNLFTIAGFLETFLITNKKVINNFKLKKNIKMTSAFSNNTHTQVITIKVPLILKTNNFIKSIPQIKTSNKELMMRLNFTKRTKKIKKRTSAK
jgi:hypothetical protein